MFSSATAQWLFLTCLPGLGRTRRRELLAEFPDLPQMLSMNAATLRAVGMAADAMAAIQAMLDEIEVEPGSQIDAGERFFLGDEEFHLRRIAL